MVSRVKTLFNGQAAAWLRFALTLASILVVVGIAWGRLDSRIDRNTEEIDETKSLSREFIRDNSKAHKDIQDDLREIDRKVSEINGKLSK